MFRALTIVAILSSGAAGADPRLAVHPLQVGGYSSAERDALKAQFVVMVARVKGLKLAGSAHVEDALKDPSAAGCELSDSGLRFLADATGSAYALYARVDEAPLGSTGTARIVRTDGAIVRNVRVDAESPRDALLLTVSRLELGSLDSGAPVAGLTLAGLSPPPMPPPVSVDERIELKRVVSWSLVGAGVLTAATGGVFAGIAATRAAANRPDASGAVTAERAEGAALALRHEQFAAVLIPAGAALAAVGALLTFWTSSNTAAVGLTVTPAGAVVSGALP